MQKQPTLWRFKCKDSGTSLGGGSNPSTHLNQLFSVMKPDENDGGNKARQTWWTMERAVHLDHIVHPFFPHDWWHVLKWLHENLIITAKNKMSHKRRREKCMLQLEVSQKSRHQWWVATHFKQKLLHLGELKILLLSPWNNPFCLPQILKMQTWICTFAWQNQRTPSIQSTSRKIQSRHIMHTGSSTAEPNRTDVSCI